MRIGIRVLDIMTKKPITVSPELSIRECAKTMLKQRVGSLIVKKDSKLLGILTEKDLVEKIIAKGNNPERYKAKNIMTTKMQTIKPSADIYDLMVRMRKRKVRRLPVVENGKFIGLITDKDVLRIEPQLFELLLERFRAIGLKKKPGQEYLEGECETC